MKTVLRNFLINLAALAFTSMVLPGLTLSGGFLTLAKGALGLMLINLAIVPLLKIMFLPLNLLTLGFFTWIINVMALYFLTTIIPQIKLVSYSFPGTNLNGFIIPQAEMNVLTVAIVASLLIGFLSHFLHWLAK